MSIIFWFVFLACQQNLTGDLQRTGQCYYLKNIHSLLNAKHYDIKDIRWTISQPEVCVSSKSVLLTDQRGKSLFCNREGQGSWTLHCENWTGTIQWEGKDKITTNALHLPFGQSGKESTLWLSSESIKNRQQREDHLFTQAFLQEKPEAKKIAGLGTISFNEGQLLLNGEDSKYIPSNCILNRRIKQPYKTLCLLNSKNIGFAYLAKDTHYEPRWIDVASSGDSPTDFRKVISLEKPVESCFDQSGRPKEDLRKKGGMDFTGELHSSVACDKSLMEGSESKD